MLVNLYNTEGKQSGQVDLPDHIFGIEPNEHAMHQAVVTYLAHQRQGTRKTKLRNEVSGGGKKPWRQKGRGTARSGSSRSPLWSGGGTVHGPKAFPYTLKITKKLKQLARKSALSMRISEDNFILVEDFKFNEIKTQQFAAVLKNLNLDTEKTLVLTPGVDNNVFLSGRNIDNVNLAPADKISTYDILIHKKILLFQGAIETIVNTFGN
ncbi:MAG: 50S ribosomal protein L4 [Candidatus Kapabacteria bacterium]|nr:50S ribosomal protein L4 [Candidatus Kapabacteria bacterium]